MTLRTASILSVLLLVSGTVLPSQAQSRFPKRPGFMPDEKPAPANSSTRPSHLRIPSFLDKDPNPEETLESRLGGLRKRQEELDLRDKAMLNKDMQELAKKLLGNKDLIDSLRNKLSPEDIERLQRKLSRGIDLFDDEGFRKLAAQWRLNNKLSDRDQETLRRWAEKFPPVENGENVNPPQINPPKINQGQPNGPPEGQPPAANQNISEPWNPIDTPTPEWLKGSMEKWIRNIDKWIDSPTGASWRDTLRKLATRFEKGKSTLPELTRRAQGFTRYLPRLSNFVPRGTLPRLSPSIPTLPRLGALPSFSGVRSASPGDFGKLLLWVIVLAALLYLLFKASGIGSAMDFGKKGASFHAGPWPVQPQAITTRADLVRAFEHLALVTLGVAARPRHHLDLELLLLQIRSLDPDRRKDALQNMVRLYEMARYTPDEEPLTPEDLQLARQEMSYLVGSSAA